jgi:DNA repair protein RAD57
LATGRLSQLLNTHPLLSSLSNNEKPSLLKVLSIQTPDLESQDHIIRYQLPIAVKRNHVGLVVIDSIAANFRAEFEKPGSKEGSQAMRKRTTLLTQLGSFLRNLAETEDIAIVVANQVADRFQAVSIPASQVMSRPTSYSSQVDVQDHIEQSTKPLDGQTHQQTATILTSSDPLTLDHQQRWFTGWGDEESPSASVRSSLKTPSLGLVWTNQLACRIALVKEPIYGRARFLENGASAESESDITHWRRWAKLVFAPWTQASAGTGLEFEISSAGVRTKTAD